MSTNCVYYLIINPSQTQPLNVVNKCLKHFSDLFQREPRYNDYDILSMFYNNGVCSFLEGEKEQLNFINAHLIVNNISSNLITKNEFQKQLELAKQKFDHNKKIKIIFSDQEFEAHPSITNITINDTNEYDDYLVKMI